MVCLGPMSCQQRRKRAVYEAMTDWSSSSFATPRPRQPHYVCVCIYFPLLCPPFHTTRLSLSHTVLSVPVMAEDVQSKAPEAAPQAAEVVVSDEKAVQDVVPEEEKAAEDVLPEEKKADVAVNEEKASGAAVADEKESGVAAETPPAPEADEKAPKGEGEAGAVDASVPVDPHKKALEELKQLVQAALANNEFVLPPPPPPAAPAEEKEPAKEEKLLKNEEAPAAPEETKPAETDTAEKVEALPEKPVEDPVAPAKEEPLPEKPVQEPAAPSKEDHLTPPPAPEEEKPTAADDDGAKTVEAIAETVVSVTATTEEPSAPPAAVEEESAAKEPETENLAAKQPPEEVFIWGVPLLGDERSDTILLKFLRARDFKVNEAMTMLKDAILWRKQFGVDALLEDDLGLPELEKAVFMHGVNREGHPVCYNIYGEFQNKELYEKAFGDDDKRLRFLKWRIQYLEKGIREQLDFTPGGVSSMVQVTDLRNSPRLGKHRQVTKQALTLLQDNYPEFIAKKVFINVPWWYLAVNRMMSPFFTQRTKSKFVFAGPSNSAETLFKYIAPEQVPVAYGGLNNENDTVFTSRDPVTDVSVKPSSKQSIEIPANEACFLEWEIRVLGWEVSCGSEFVPQAEDGYTVIVQKTRKLVATDEPVIKGSFKIGEPGKVVLNIENPTSKKKKVLYRFKTKSSTESF